MLSPDVNSDDRTSYECLSTNVTGQEKSNFTLTGNLNTFISNFCESFTTTFTSWYLLAAMTFDLLLSVVLFYYFHI